jgi:hypothetical protein
MVRLSRGARLQQARDREFANLEKPAEAFPGRVWGCARWRKCDMRVIETPPYGDEAPAGTCANHGLAVDTKIVERRFLGGEPSAGT